MATLQAVYNNIALGAGVSTICFLAFGLAVNLEANKNLTPRAWARPVNVVKNVLKKPYCVSWISWAMQLRYIDLLSGIPGTGTRNQGWSGPTLRTNLDGIVLLRYHTLQFKVSLFATFWCMILLLPLYWTSECDPEQSGEKVCADFYNHTDFEKLTMANVVPHHEVAAVSENGTVIQTGNYTLGDLRLINIIEWNWIPAVTERYAAYTLTIALITLYTCYLLWHEWVECLALRRVYYLESELYEERLDELDEIRTNFDEEDPFQKVRPPFLPHPEMRETIPNVSLHSALYKLPSDLCTKYLKNKNINDQSKSLLELQLEEAAIFFDQCIPAQKGFTSSVAAITMIPDATKLSGVWMKWYILGNKMRRIRFIKHMIKTRKEMQRTGQKGVYDFFVVAPACAAENAIKATTEGFEAMTEKINEGIEAMKGISHKANKNKDGDEQEEDKNKMPSSQTELRDGSVVIASAGSKTDDVEAFVKGEDDSKSVGEKGMCSGNVSNIKSSPSLIIPNANASEREEFSSGITDGDRSSVPGFRDSDGMGRFDYDEFDPKTFAKWIGYSEETELEELIDTLEVEQLSVFARESSQSASNPCVYGCAPESLRFASIEQLEEMLEDAWEDAREANALLLLERAEMFRRAGGRGTVEVPSADKASMKKNDDASAAADDTNAPSKEIEKEKTIPSIPEDSNAEDFPIPSDLGRQKSERPSGLRQRGKQLSRTLSVRERYDKAQELVKETTAVSVPTNDTGEEVKGCCSCPGAVSGYMGRETQVAKNLVNVLDHNSYCVVTFTSRQAAVAARQCLADGKGNKRWKQIQNIPMYPLADAPPLKPFFCRGCCRPVTLTIPDSQKRSRKICIWTLYILFCFLYTIPLTLSQQLFNPTWMLDLFPDSTALNNPESIFFDMLAGFSSGLVQTVFFSVLPQVFKLLAFSDGTSSSKPKAEENALMFYWYFMLVTAFTGTALLQLLIASLVEGNVSDEVKDLLGAVAGTMLTQQAPTWLNWIIVRTSVILPINYFLQTMTFVWGWVRIHWLNRVMRGGGPGGPPPYRIYVDSGVVFMCITSLAPACPIIAPAATIYYIIFIPMLRWLHIFVYRPFYDGGGSMLPLLHEIIISSLILGQILLGTLALLKQSFIGGTIIFMLTIPTHLFSTWTKEKFKRSYEDAALWQTFSLDGLTEYNRTAEEREKYRRWLIDCHKASYVPICLSGGDDFLTIQPASVVSTDNDPRIRRFTSTRLYSNTRPSPKHGKTVAEKGAI